MPLEHRIEPEKHRAFVTVSGSFTIEEIVDTIDAVVGDPRFALGFHILSDHTGVTAPITAPQLTSMVEHLEGWQSKLQGARWAVITTAPASYGMMRMLGVLAEAIPMDVEVFGSMDEAEAWLRSA